MRALHHSPKACALALLATLAFGHAQAEASLNRPALATARIAQCEATPPDAVAAPLPATIARAMNAVVALEAPAPPERTSTDLSRRLLGTGVIATAEGLIITNAHVLGGRETLVARLGDGRRVRVRVLGTDRRVDLAVLSIESAPPPQGGWPVLRFATARAPQIGEAVVALGNPLHFGFSATRGIVSGLGRAYDVAWPVDFLQHDAALNPGNSGGPLIDAWGCVLGINTATPEETVFDIGVGLAIPADLIAQVAPQLAAQGRFARGILGVMASGASPDIAGALGAAGEEGVLVDDVEAGSAAAQAGLLPGDIVTHIEGHATGLPRDISLALLRRRPGERVRVRIVRAGQADVIQAILGEEREQAPRPSKPQASAGAGAPSGIALIPDVNGRPVIQVTPDSAADRAGLQDGDQLDAINGAAVSVLIQARTALETQIAAGPVVLRVLRPGQGRRHVMLGPSTTSGIENADASRLPHGPI